MYYAHSRIARLKRAFGVDPAVVQLGSRVQVAVYLERRDFHAPGVTFTQLVPIQRVKKPVLISVNRKDGAGIKYAQRSFDAEAVRF